MKQVFQINEGNTAIGMWSGFIGGLGSYLLQVHVSFWGNLLQAAITAFICGACGVAGKEAIVAIKKRIQNRKKKISDGTKR